MGTKKFSDQVGLNPQALQLASGYARNFLRWLNDQDPNNLSDISQGEDVSELCKSFIPSGEESEDPQNSPPDGSLLRRLSRHNSRLRSGGSRADTAAASAAQSL